MPVSYIDLNQLRYPPILYFKVKLWISLQAKALDHTLTKGGRLTIEDSGRETCQLLGGSCGVGLQCQARGSINDSGYLLHHGRVERCTHGFMYSFPQ